MNFKDYYNIIKFHGFYRGILRIKDEIVEIHYFDWKFKVNTKDLKFANQYKHIDFNPDKHKHYQPTFYTPLKKVGLFLNKFQLSKKNAIVDLGCGYGKPLIILNKFINSDNALYGVELDIDFKKIFLKNFKNKNVKFVNKKVEDFKMIDFYETLDRGTETVIFHNKNSFGKEIVRKNLEEIKYLKNKNLKVLYIFSNPEEFTDLFQNYKLIFKVRGWHKNHNINVYEI